MSKLCLYLPKLVFYSLLDPRSRRWLIAIDSAAAGQEGLESGRFLHNAAQGAKESKTHRTVLKLSRRNRIVIIAREFDAIDK
jgi:hypothetical protein